MNIHERVAAVLCACVGVGLRAQATVVVPADLGELSRDALAIARGRVVALDARWTDDRRRVETLVTLEAESYLKGALGPVVQFRVPGGRLGRYRSIRRGRAGVCRRRARGGVPRRARTERAVRARDEPGRVSRRAGRPGMAGRHAAGDSAGDGRNLAGLSFAVTRRAGRCRSRISSGRSACWRERHNEAARRDRRRMRVDCRPGRSGARVFEVRRSREPRRRDAQVGPDAGSLFRHQSRRARRRAFRISRPRSAARSRRGKPCPPRRSPISSAGSQPRSRRRRRPIDAGVFRGAGARSRAGVDELSDRLVDRRADRVRHLLQLRVSVVGRGGRRGRPLRSGIDRRARNRALQRSGPFGARRNGARQRR